jgi:hypothetical protein
MGDTVEDHRPLPGNPRTWQELRRGLKLLIARAELTGVAVERLSTDPECRRRGAESIADSTVSRKLADRDEPVDARSLRTIVTVCRVAAERAGRPVTDADPGRWLAARTALAEGRPSQDVPPLPARRLNWVPALAAALVLLAAAGTVWAVNRHPADAAVRSVPSPSPSPSRCLSPAGKPVTAGLTIGTPEPGSMLHGKATEARGTLTLQEGERPPWVMLYAVGECRYYLEQPVTATGHEWTTVVYVDPSQTGAYMVFIAAVDAADDANLARLASAGGSPNITRLPPSARYVAIDVRCCG